MACRVSVPFGVRLALRPPAAASLRAAFLAATAAWAVLLPAATWLAGRAHVSAIGSAMIIGVYAVGSAICHQRPERSFHLWTAQMPVCARCTGIYVGAVIGAAASAWSRRAPVLRHGRRGAGLGRGTVRVALALAVTPSFLTLMFEWTTGLMPSHAIRAAAGLPLGIVAAWLVVAATDNRVN
jgi:hypothetical protein